MKEEFNEDIKASMSYIYGRLHHQIFEENIGTKGE